MTSEIYIPKPKCRLKWKGYDSYDYIFNMGRDFNWFQQKLLKWCFGLEYEKVS